MSLISLLYLHIILQHSLGVQVWQCYSLDGAPAPKKYHQLLSNLTLVQILLPYFKAVSWYFEMPTTELHKCFWPNPSLSILSENCRYLNDIWTQWDFWSVIISDVEISSENAIPLLYWAFKARKWHTYDISPYYIQYLILVIHSHDIHKIS